MAEGQDTTTTAPQEPSMEEILASIRKIISDEDAPAAEGEAKPEASAANSEDVIELTQMVQDDGSVIDINDLPAEEPVAQPVASTPVPPEPMSMETIPTPPKSLVSENVVSTSASSLSALANTVEIERLSHVPPAGAMLGNGGRTLEDMVIELMRPMLKEWLEKNLPATVERLVQKEIERISHKAQG